MNLQGPNPEEIKNLFSTVAAGYDRANDAMTFGMAHLWRRKLVAWSEAKEGQRILDCATGTGDLAIEFKKTVGHAGQVTGIDFCEAMLDLAPPKADKHKLEIDFKVADVMNLPFSDHGFDVCSIAYGIRNVSDPGKALKEMARVVKSGGKVMILETGDAPENGLKPVFEFYIRQVIPRIGGWITGHRFAYEYLNRSSRQFPSRERFLDLMKSTGVFEKCEYQVLFGGASFLYRGTVK